MRSTAVVLLLLATYAHTAAARPAATSGDAILAGCQDSVAPVLASAPEVRRHVPARYRIVGEGLGVATLAVRIFACDSVSVPGSRPRRTLGAQFGVTLESPDGTGRVFGLDACCNWYTLFWVTDNRDLARWLKAGTGLRSVVRHVRNLVYRYRPAVGSATAAIHFVANAPTPSPFELEATVTTPPDPWPSQAISPNWWAQTRKGSVKVANHVPRFRPYHATGEIRTRAGTQMATLLRATRTPFGSPVSYGRWDQSRTMIHTTAAANAS